MVFYFHQKTLSLHVNKQNNMSIYKKIILGLLIVLFAQNTSLIGANTTSKQAIAQAVLDDIANALNESNAPVLQIVSNAPNLVADYNPNVPPNGLIRLSEKAYDICDNLKNQSKDALAVILAHELIHHHRHHQYTVSYAYTGKNTPIKPANVRRTEAEADSLGLFYAYAAGYNVLKIAPNLLDIIYKTYQFPEKTGAYPSLKERRDMAKEQSQNLQKYAPIWEASKWLYVLNHYNEAAEGFVYLSNKLPAREMYHNAGTAKLMAALSLFDPKEQPFAYPIELDAYNRLTNTTSRGAESADLAQRTKNLNEAIKYFEKAQNIDPDYLPTQIGLAAANNLLTKTGTALDLLNGLLQKHPNYANAYTLRGIVYASKKECDNATEDFEKAKTLNGLYANANYNALMQTKDCQSWVNWVSTWFDNDATTTTPKRPNPTAEKIDNLNPKDLPKISSSTRKPITVGSWAIKFYDQNTNAYWITAPNFVLQTMQTSPNYAGKSSQNVLLKSTTADVQLSYGAPNAKVNTVQGECWVYKSGKIAFLFDKQRQVNGWMLYSYDQK
jgi:tetratricopeptide (TPR) repeat protein